MKKIASLVLFASALSLLGACGGSVPLPTITYAQQTPACSQQWVHMPMHINFPTSGTQMDYQNREVLRELVRSASQRSDIVRVRVEGHTDTCGNELNNLALSQGRASAVASELLTMGVPADRVDTIGYGSTRPRATESCGRGQSLSEQDNRRVEFELMVCR
jgi:outer membrane protein OmpA-like peptidoglycan-associated protein